MERLWAYLRSHYQSNRVFKSYKERFEIVKASWNCLDEERLKSIGPTAWVKPAI